MPLFGIGMKTDLFQSCDYCSVFQICWHIECSSFTASSFRIWSSSAEVSSPALALLRWCFLRPTWLHISGCLTLVEWSHHHEYLGHEDLFCTILLCTLAWRIPWPEEPGKLQSTGSQRVGHDWETSLSFFHNHGVIMHLEPDILECEVKWALESITMNKAGGGDGIPAELFQILKNDAVKVLHSIC